MKPVANKGSKPVSGKTSGSKNKAGIFTRTYNLLFHDDVYYKIGGFLIFGLLLFLVTWALFMFLIKAPNLLSDSFIVQKIFKSETVKSFGPWDQNVFNSNWKVFSWNIKVGNFINVALLTIKYFFNHLLFVLVFIWALNLFKIGRWNMSMIYFTVYTVLWGIVMGTNSLPFPVGANAVWGSLLLFIRFGLWTWFAYMLLLVSTTQFSWLAAPSWTKWQWVKERKFWPVHFTPDQREVFIYGLLFLLAASFTEARIFVFYNPF